MSTAFDARSYEQIKVVAITVVATLGAVRLWDRWKNRDVQQSLYGKLHTLFFDILYRIPKFRKIKEQKLNEIKDSFERSVLNDRRNAKTIIRLPSKSTRKEDILKLLNENLELGSFDWKNGRVSGAVYRYDKDLIEMLSEVYTLTSYTNPLHPDIFPGVNKMEAEVIRIVSCLFHGDNRTCGSITSGGTESILMACKAYRDYGRLTKNIHRPEILVPVTAHAAFDKAAQYFGLVIRHVPIDNKSAKVSVQLMEKYINSNTIMLAGSTPNFPYGTIDDIVAIGALGKKYNIPVHVDACLGGFLLVFMNKAGYKIAPFDFQVAGVTSISVDSHKYGYCPKGSSIVLYSDEKYFKYQFSTVHSWPGGCYASPTTSGSRPGSAISTLWATLLYFGENEFIEATRSIIQTTQYILKCLKSIDGLEVFGEPEVSVIAVRSSKFDIFLLLNFLKNRSWNLNNLQYPSGFHLCVTYMHTRPGIADRFVHDVQDGVANIFANFKNLPKLDDQLSLYGMAQTISDKEIISDILRTYLTSLYIVNKDGNSDDDQQSL